MTNKTQKAALLRIAQIEDSLKEFMKKDKAYGKGESWPSYRPKTIYIGYYESLFERSLKEIDELIENHNLSKEISKNFKNYFIHIIYEKAIMRKEFSWATEFAAKYKI